MSLVIGLTSVVDVLDQMSVRLLQDSKFATAQKEKKFSKGYALKVITGYTNNLFLINISFEKIFEKFYCPMKAFE